MMNVLVVPCGTEIAHEIVRSLKDVKNTVVFGANGIKAYTEIPSERVSNNIPFIDDEGFIESIASLIKEWGITHIIPAHDSAALKLSESAPTLSAKIVSSPYETNMVCRSKKLTYERLTNVVKTPKLFQQTDELEFPLFVKPDVGQGSVGTRLVREENALELNDDELLCEYLPGEEFTVDCVSNHLGELIFASARKRNQTRNGIAVETELVQDQERFRELAIKISSTLDLRGGWFFQVKEAKDGELCLLEVATRIAGSMITSRFNGINFTELSLLVSNDIPISVSNNNLNVKVYRNLNFQFETNLDFDVIYTDYDDCLLLEERFINAELVKVIFEAINAGKKVKLITRHAGNLKESLEKYRLTELFDEVIHIKDNDTLKSNFISDEKAIFIDDSFRERKDVSSRLGIPCFSVDMIRGLSCLRN